MPQDATVAELFKLAIDLEKAAEELYRRLESKFAHRQKVADFWKEYATEEAGHAKWLERLRDGSSPEDLSALGNPLMLEEARKLLQYYTETDLAGIENLRDAYQLADELENSEINAIFEFLVDNFSADEKMQDFLRSLLKDHIAKLMLWFPTQFDDLALDE